MALLRPLKALTELDCEAATLLEAATARAAAGAMVAAAMQEAMIPSQPNCEVQWITSMVEV